MKDLLILSQSGETLPSVRFRVLPYVRAARELGLDADWRPIPGAFVKRLPFLNTLPHAQVILIQKKLFAPWEIKLLRGKCQTLAFDFDDALWTSHPCEKRTAKLARRELRNRLRLENTVRSVDVVVAGNAFLRQYVRAAAPYVLVLPTPIDTELYTPAESRPERPFTIGWMGASCNLFFLPEILDELGPLYGQVSLKIVSDERYTGDTPLPIEFEHWSSEREVEQLRSFDVGLMPLTNDEYTRGKCGFKLLQYMACGVAPIASRVGFNREIIQDGVNGFLVDGEGEWIEKITRLRDDPALLASMTRAARETVEQRFSLKGSAWRLFEALGLAPKE